MPSNAVSMRDSEIVERAGTHVGDLAHALKTALSVIINEAREKDGPLAAKVIEQAELMRTGRGPLRRHRPPRSTVCSRG